MKLSGASAGSKYSVKANSEINVTPFVDVMLVLLIVLMVSAPLATTATKLDMPPATPSPGDVEPPVFVSIQGANDLYIGRGELPPRPTTLERLPADLAARIGKPNAVKEQVFVRAESEVSYDDFMQVLNVLQDNGFKNLGLINEEIS